MKYLPYILITILLGIIAYLYFNPIKQIDTKPLTNKIDSLSALIEKDELVISNLIKVAETNEIKENEYIKEADSLALVISKLNVHNDCPKIVNVQNKEIISLRNGLEKCNKAKTIYVKTIGVCQDIIVKYELKEISAIELNKALLKNYKKEKKKSFLLGAGVGITSTLLLLLLL